MNNPYLEKIAEKKGKENEKEGYSGFRRAGIVLASSMLPSAVAAPVTQHLAHSSIGANMESITEKDVASYRKARNLRHVTWDKSQSPMGGHYVPSAMSKGKPIVVTDKPFIAMHEHGHAHSFNSSRKLGTLKAKLGGTIASNALIARQMGTMAGAYAATSSNEKVRNATPYVVGAAAAPMLVEEARATIDPYNHLRKTRGKELANKFLKKMAPAYGTYVTLAGAAVGSSALAKHLTEKKIKADRAKAGK